MKRLVITAAALFVAAGVVAGCGSGLTVKQQMGLMCEEAEAMASGNDARTGQAALDTLEKDLDSINDNGTSAQYADQLGQDEAVGDATSLQQDVSYLVDVCHNQGFWYFR